MPLIARVQPAPALPLPAPLRSGPATSLATAPSASTSPKRPPGPDCATAGPSGRHPRLPTALPHRARCQPAPVIIAAQLAGHRSLNTHSGYVAIYPQDVFNHYDQFLERRPLPRPSHGHANPPPTSPSLRRPLRPTPRRTLGDCVRPAGSGCTTNTPVSAAAFCMSQPTPPRDWTHRTGPPATSQEASTQQWLAAWSNSASRCGDSRTKRSPWGEGEAQPRGLRGFTVHRRSTCPLSRIVGVYNPTSPINAVSSRRI